MKRILLGLLLLYFSTTGYSQDTNTSQEKLRYRKQLNASAKDQINQLKDGVLLVRLKTRNNAINALRKIERNVQADELERKQDIHNLHIIQAFKTNFNFCPTYFFYSDYSTNVKENQLNQVIFLNDSLETDKTITVTNKKFLVAEFGTIAQDTAKHFSHYSYETNGNFKLKEISNYYGGPSFGFNALIISSEKLIQLRRPFPYYVKTRDSMPRKKVIFRAVRKMNKKLYKFYTRKNKK